MTRRSRASALLLAAAALTACGDGDRAGAEPESKPSTFTIRGVMAVPADNPDPAEYSWCLTSSGYRDIAQGADVTVTDADGTVVGTGELGPAQNDEKVICQYGFTVADVPDGSAFYGIEVSDRGAVRFKRAELDQDVTLRLD